MSSNRKVLVGIGLLVALSVLVLVGVVPESRVDPILELAPWIEGLIMVAIAADTHRRFGGDRPALDVEPVPPAD